MGSRLTNLILFILKWENIKAYYISSYIGLQSDEINKSDLNNLLKEKFSNRESIENLIQKFSKEISVFRKI